MHWSVYCELSCALVLCLFSVLVKMSQSRKSNKSIRARSGSGHFKSFRNDSRRQLSEKRSSLEDKTPSNALGRSKSTKSLYKTARGGPSRGGKSRRYVPGGTTRPWNSTKQFQPGQSTKSIKPWLPEDRKRSVTARSTSRIVPGGTSRAWNSTQQFTPGAGQSNTFEQSHRGGSRGWSRGGSRGRSRGMSRGMSRRGSFRNQTRIEPVIPPPYTRQEFGPKQQKSPSVMPRPLSYQQQSRSGFPTNHRGPRGGMRRRGWAPWRPQTKSRQVQKPVKPTSELAELKKRLAAELEEQLSRHPIRDLRQVFRLLAERIDKDAEMRRLVDEAQEQMQKLWKKSSVSAQEAITAGRQFIKRANESIADKRTVLGERFAQMAAAKFTQAIRQMPPNLRQQDLATMNSQIFFSLMEAFLLAQQAVLNRIQLHNNYNKNNPDVEQVMFQSDLSFKYYREKFIRVGLLWLRHYSSIGYTHKNIDYFAEFVCERQANQLYQELEYANKNFEEQKETNGQKVRFEPVVVPRKTQKRIWDLLDKTHDCNFAHIYATWQYVQSAKDRQVFDRRYFTIMQNIAHAYEPVREAIEKNEARLEKMKPKAKASHTFQQAKFGQASKANQSCAHITNALRRITLDPQNGGSIRARRRFGRGEVVFQEKALAFKWNRNLIFCEECHRLAGPQFSSCENCSRAVYCNDICQLVSERAQAYAAQHVHDKKMCANSGLMFNRDLSSHSFLLVQLFKYCGNPDNIADLVNSDGSNKTFWLDRLTEIQHFDAHTQWPFVAILMLFSKFSDLRPVERIEPSLMVETYHLMYVIHKTFDNANLVVATENIVPLLYTALRFLRSYSFSNIKIKGKPVIGAVPRKTGRSTRFVMIPYGIALGAFSGVMSPTDNEPNVRRQFNASRGTIEYVACKPIPTGAEITCEPLTLSDAEPSNKKTFRPDMSYRI